MKKHYLIKSYLDVKLNLLCFVLEDYTYLLALYYFVQEFSQNKNKNESKEITLQFIELFLKEGIIKVGKGLDGDFTLLEGTPEEIVQQIKKEWDDLKEPLTPYEVVNFDKTKKSKEEFEAINYIPCLQDEDDDSELVLLQKRRIRSIYLNVKLDLLFQGLQGSIDLFTLQNIVEKYSYSEDPNELKRITIALVEIYLKEGSVFAKQLNGSLNPQAEDPEAVVSQIEQQWDGPLKPSDIVCFKITEKGIRDYELFKSIPFLQESFD